ncbi:RluA family pseudouridine synthase [Hyphomonas sp. WL0036]|uniref:RluA family pseudouridine synthase n=1 Tax=Hyphomonas sediminis TaxID=2866160 RepID=UPI001C7F46FE|nr:RluA family pseudouridine synthase [Hyphomonas sediminis]
MTQILITSEADDAGQRLDAFLGAKAEGLSRSRAKALIEEGAVTVAGAVEKNPRAPIKPGLEYAVNLPPPVPATPQAEAIALDILFEDEHLIVLNKPAGLAVHPAPGSETGTLVNALLHHCQGQLSGIGGVERPGIVHRLDKLTSGVMVAAKTEAAHIGLAALFERHDIDRLYRAITRGAPRPLSGTIEASIARSENDRKKMSVHKNPDSPSARHAVTHYRAVETYGYKDRATRLPAAAMIECRLETGRTHQIRVHMTHVGAPLIGDPVYGRQSGIMAWKSPAAPEAEYDAALAAARAFPRQALHAAVLGFVHPITGETHRFEQPLPADMAGLVAALRKLPVD